MPTQSQYSTPSVFSNTPHCRAHSGAKFTLTNMVVLIHRKRLYTFVAECVTQLLRSKYLLVRYVGTQVGLEVANAPLSTESPDRLSLRIVVSIQAGD